MHFLALNLKKKKLCVIMGKSLQFKREAGVSLGHTKHCFFLSRKVSNGKSLKLRFMRSPSTSNRNQENFGRYSKAESLKSSSPSQPSAARDETLETLQFSISKPWAGVVQLPDHREGVL